MHFKLKNVQTMLGILLTTILKIINSRFYENFYSKIFRMLPVLIYCSGIFGGKRNIGSTSENIKCGNLKKNRVIYHNEEKRLMI